MLVMAMVAVILVGAWAVFRDRPTTYAGASELLSTVWNAQDSLPCMPIAPPTVKPAPHDPIWLVCQTPDDPGSAVILSVLDNTTVEEFEQDPCAQGIELFFGKSGGWVLWEEGQNWTGYVENEGVAPQIADVLGSDAVLCPAED